MHSTDYASRAPRHKAPCLHPRERIVKVGDKLWKCCVCLELRGSMSIDELCALEEQAKRISVYNQAMRTNRSRRKFILTGEL